MEELRQKEANLTALAAIGPRKQRRIDLAGSQVSIYVNLSLLHLCLSFSIFIVLYIIRFVLFIIIA